jgi:hypothetical protein
MYIGISNLDHIQAIWPGSNSGPCSVTQRQQFTCPGNCFTAAANIHQHTGNISNHVVQECIGCHVNDNEFTSPTDPYVLNVPQRGPGLAICCPKGRKIILTQQ